MRANLLVPKFRRNSRSQLRLLQSVIRPARLPRQTGDLASRSRHIIAALCWLGLVIPGPLAMGQGGPPTPIKDVNQISLPTEALESILARDRRGVVLPRTAFEELSAKARQNAIETPKVPNGIVLVRAVYHAHINGSQLVLTANLDLTQVAGGWHSFPLAFRGVAVEKATLDGQPAVLARGDKALHLFADRKGPHALVMELAAPVSSSGADRAAAFGLGGQPMGMLEISVAARERLSVDEAELKRPAPIEKEALYTVPIGGKDEIRLLISNREFERPADRLVFANTAYRLRVSPGDAAWQAVAALDVYGSAVDRITATLPAGLKITGVESAGLDSWNVAEGSGQTPATISLAYRQPFKGPRTIELKGILRPTDGKRWTVGALRIAGVSSHVGRIQIERNSHLRLKLLGSSDVRPVDAAANTPDTKPASPMGSRSENSVSTPINDVFTDRPAAEPSFQSSSRPGMAQAPLLFDAWNESFSLSFVAEPKPQEVLVNSRTSLQLSVAGLELEVAAMLESLYGPLFEVEITLPAEWSVTRVTVAGGPVTWNSISAEAGTHHLVVPVTVPISAGKTVSLGLAARRSISPWPIDETGVEISLPEVRFLNTGVVVGSYVIKAPDDFELTPSDVAGLDPAHLNLSGERIGYRYQDTRFSGKLKIFRRPARLSAETILVARLDPAAMRTYLRTAIEARGGGFRRLDLVLPASVAKDVRFRADRTDLRMIEQNVLDTPRGERLWSLTFDQFVKGAINLETVIETPRGDAKEFVVPEPRLEGVARQLGTYVVQAGPDQQVNVTADGPDKEPLTQIDPADLPPLPFAPSGRAVAAYRFIQPKNRVALTETKLTPVPVARAVCQVCEIDTLLGKAGDRQHRARFQFVSSGAQSVRVALPDKAVLWSALMNDAPAEVRVAGQYYLIPLSAATGPDGERTLTLFYATPALVDSPLEPQEDSKARFRQSPPEVSVVGGTGGPETMEILSRTWRLHYPRDWHATQSRGPFEPAIPLTTASPLGQFAGNPQIESTERFWWKLLYAVATIAVMAFCVKGFAQSEMRGFLAVGVIAIIGVCIVPLTRGCSSSAPSISSMKGLGISEREQLAASKYTKAASGSSTLPPAPAAARPAEPAKGAPARREGFTGGGRLSVPMTFETPDEDSMREFRFMGDVPHQQPPTAVPANGSPVVLNSTSTAAMSPEIDVEFESVSRARIVCLALMAAVAFLFWCVRRASVMWKALLVMLGLVFPVALIGLVPITVQIWLDGLFFGTIGGLVLWYFHRRAAADTSTGASPRSKILETAVALLAIAASGRTMAAGPDGDGAMGHPMQQRAALPKNNQPADSPPEAKSPLVSGTGKENPAVIVPYDPAGDPLTADRVFLNQRMFFELWNRAHPEKPLGRRPVAKSGVAAAIYSARIAAQPNDSGTAHAAITGRLVLESFVDRPITVALPFQEAAIGRAKLDGRAATLIPVREQKRGAQPVTRFETVLATRGVHVLDVELDVPARMNGPNGEFTVRLFPVASGRLSFELPAGADEVLITGSEAGFRRRTKSGKESVDVAIGSASDLTIAWQPKRGPSGAGAKGDVEADAASAVVIEDSGLTVHNHYRIHIGQGVLSEIVFTLPPNLKLRDIQGSHVSGWRFEGNDPGRRLTVTLRGAVRGETQLSLDFYRNANIGEKASLLEAPLIAPLNIARETGTVALFAGPQFTIGAGAAINVRQIDAREFAATAQVALPGGKLPLLAYRYSARPIRLEWNVARQRPETDVSAMHAIIAGRRKLTFSSCFRLDVTGTALTEASIAVPQGFVPLSVEGQSVADWFLDETSGNVRQPGKAAGTRLAVEFSSPQQGRFELIVNGTVAKTPDEPKVPLDVPTLADVRRSQAVLAVWPDETYQATIDRSEDWRSMQPEQAPKEITAILPKAPTFVFQTSRPNPAAVVLNLSRAAPRLSGDSATIVTVTDTAVFYTLALNWTISQAASDTFLLTTPDWLMGRLDFIDPNSLDARNPRLRQVTSAKLPDGRIRWTISLQDPVRARFFLSATAVLPPPGEGTAATIAAPLLEFDSDENGDALGRRMGALGTQRHFLVLVNQSSARLAPVDADAIEPVSREEIPIGVDAGLLQQAMQVGRLIRPAVFRVDRPAAQKGAPAAVNLAALTTMIERNGSWRTRAIYRIKNRSRQFVAVQIPPESEILSVWVQNKPSRPVVLNRNEKTLRLIPLPAASEADLAFEVRIVLAGHLSSGALPQGFRLVADKLQLPVPQVVSPESDPAYGIPVARTEWTTYFPNDEEVGAVDDPRQTNMSLANENAAAQFERAALIDEMGQLFSGLLEIGTSPSNRQYRDRALKNLSRLNGELDQSLQSAPQTQGKSDSAAALELGRAADLKRKFEEYKSRSQLYGESQTTDDAGKEGLTPQSQSLQARDLINRNSQRVPDTDADAANDLAEIGQGKKPAFGFDQEKSARPNEEFAGKSRDAAGSRTKLKGSQIFKQAPGLGPFAGQPITINQAPKGGEDKGREISRLPRQAVTLPAPPPQSEPTANVGGRGEGSLAAPRSPGSLSLDFDIPTSGRKVVFTKPGGDPKLTISVRPQKSFSAALAIVWMVVWGTLGVAAAASLGCATCSVAGRKYLPRTVMAVGLVFFLFMSAFLSWIGLAVLAIATAIEVLRRKPQGTAAKPVAPG